MNTLALVATCCLFGVPISKQLVIASMSTNTEHNLLHSYLQKTILSRPVFPQLAPRKKSLGSECRPTFLFLRDGCGLYREE